MPHQGCNKQQEPASGRCHRRRHEESSDSENEHGCNRMRGFRGMRHGPYHFGHHGMRGGLGAHHCMFWNRHQPEHFGHHHGGHHQGHHHGMPGGRHHSGPFGHHEMSPNFSLDFNCRRGPGRFNHHEMSGSDRRPDCFGHREPAREEQPRGEDQGCRFAQRQRRHSIDNASIEKHQCQHRKH